MSGDEADPSPVVRRTIARKKALASIEKNGGKCTRDTQCPPTASRSKKIKKGAKNKRAGQKTRTSGSSSCPREGHEFVPGSRKKKAPSSRPADRRTVIEKVIDYLAKHPDMDYTPKDLVLLIGCKHEAIKKAVQREMNQEFPQIVETQNGYYRTVLNIDTLRRVGNSRRVGLHGIKLEGRIYTKCPPTNTGYSLCPSPDTPSLVPKRTPVSAYRKRETYVEYFLARKVTITIHESGLAEVWLNTSKVPLDYPDFEKFMFWVFGRFTGQVLDESWKVSQLGLNVDFQSMRVEGLESMSLKAFRNAWFQVYQKEADVVRVESHIMPDLQLKDCAAVIMSLVKTVEMTRGENREGPYEPPKKPASKWDRDPSYA